MKNDTLISLFPSAMAKEPDEAITMSAFLDGVKNGRWENVIAPLREHIHRGDRPRYNDKKRRLPAVTISCHCLSREIDLTAEQKAVTHSGWLQADFDGADNPLLTDADVAAAKRADLLADPHVGAVFVGPSGEGLKSIIAIDGERHKESWFAAEAHFREKHGLILDKATKDAMRLCFVSYDPDLEISDNVKVLPVPDKPTESNTWYPPLETTSADVCEMLQFIPPRPDYDTWLRIASAVWSVLPMGEGCQALNAWSPEEKAGEYATKHKVRLHQIGVGTLAHIASQYGFDAQAAARRKRWAGRIRFAEADRTDKTDSAETAQSCTAVAELTRERIMEAFRAAQVGDARLWCVLRAGVRVWNIHAKCWMIYSNGVWRRDVGMTSVLDISDTVVDAYRRVAKTIKQEMADSPAPDKKKDSRGKEIADIESRCVALQKSEYLSGVEKLAMKQMHLPATSFDSGCEILVLTNGTLDFREGLFREHRGSDYATCRSPIAFDPAAECPRWMAFLERCFHDDETRAYVSRAFGYCLTGLVHEDALFFCHGSGANGKSTFLAVLKMVLGELMTTVPFAALTAAKSDNNFDYYKANMEGKRVVVTDEIPEGRKLAEGQIKALTGGDMINARRPFEQPYTFPPTHKLWLMGNHKPDIKGTDEGIWRRVHMIPFLVTIPVEERRPRHEVLAEFLAEAPGILNWAVRGLLESRDIGLRPPPQVVDATASYREESDQFGAFLAECTVPDVTGTCGAGSLSKVYETWCEDNGEIPHYKGTRKIRKTMGERGYHVEVDRNNHPTICGLSIRQNETEKTLTLHA